MSAAAALLTQDLEPVLLVVHDGEQAHCMTESLLDTCWNSLRPEEKADVHERWLDADLQPAAPALPEAAVDLALRIARHPLNAVYAEAERIAAEHRKPFRPDMPTFSPAELAWLQRKPRRQN